jgi:hypothetical protein
MTTDGRDAAIDAKLQQAFAALRAESGPDHPSEDDWARFAGNEMSSDERTRLADHVVSCTECAAIFRVVAAVGADAKGTEAHRRSAFGDWRVLAAAAAVVMTIGLGAWWAIRGADNDSQRAGTEPQPPTVTPPVEAPAAQSPLWASLSTAPDVRLPPDLVLTMRGVDGDRDAFLKVFGEAIAPYRAGRFAEAAAALTPVAERYADVVEVSFYLGTARLLSGAAPEAIEPLRRARGSAVVGEDARWLEAVALQRAGRESDARTSLQALCAAPGPNRERACAVIKQ